MSEYKSFLSTIHLNIENLLSTFRRNDIPGETPEYLKDELNVLVKRLKSVNVELIEEKKKLDN